MGKKSKVQVCKGCGKKHRNQSDRQRCYNNTRRTPSQMNSRQVSVINHVENLEQSEYSQIGQKNDPNVPEVKEKGFNMKEIIQQFKMLPQIQKQEQFYKAQQMGFTKPVFDSLEQEKDLQKIMRPKSLSQKMAIKKAKHLSKWNSMRNRPSQNFEQFYKNINSSQILDMKRRIRYAIQKYHQLDIHTKQDYRKWMLKIVQIREQINQRVDIQRIDKICQIVREDIFSEQIVNFLSKKSSEINQLQLVVLEQWFNQMPQIAVIQTSTNSIEAQLEIGQELQKASKRLKQLITRDIRRSSGNNEILSKDVQKYFLLPIDQIAHPSQFQWILRQIKKQIQKFQVKQLEYLAREKEKKQIIQSQQSQTTPINLDLQISNHLEWLKKIGQESAKKQYLEFKMNQNQRANNNLINQLKKITRNPIFQNSKILSDAFEYIYQLEKNKKELDLDLRKSINQFIVQSNNYIYDKRLSISSTSSNNLVTWSHKGRQYLVSRKCSVKQPHHLNYGDDGQKLITFLLNISLKQIPSDLWQYRYYREQLNPIYHYQLHKQQICAGKITDFRLKDWQSYEYCFQTPDPIKQIRLAKNQEVYDTLVGRMNNIEWSIYKYCKTLTLRLAQFLSAISLQKQCFQYKKNSNLQQSQILFEFIQEIIFNLQVSEPLSVYRSQKSLYLQKSKDGVKVSVKICSSSERLSNIFGHLNLLEQTLWNLHKQPNEFLIESLQTLIVNRTFISDTLIKRYRQNLFWKEAFQTGKKLFKDNHFPISQQQNYVSNQQKQRIQIQQQLKKQLEARNLQALAQNCFKKTFDDLSLMKAYLSKIKSGHNFQQQIEAIKKKMIDKYLLLKWRNFSHMKSFQFITSDLRSLTTYKVTVNDDYHFIKNLIETQLKFSKLFKRRDYFQKSIVDCSERISISNQQEYSYVRKKLLSKQHQQLIGNVDRAYKQFHSLCQQINFKLPQMAPIRQYVPVQSQLLDQWQIDLQKLRKKRKLNKQLDSEADTFLRIISGQKKQIEQKISIQNEFAQIASQSEKNQSESESEQITRHRKRIMHPKREISNQEKILRQQRHIQHDFLNKNYLDYLNSRKNDGESIQEFKDPSQKQQSKGLEISIDKPLTRSKKVENVISQKPADKQKQQIKKIEIQGMTIVPYTWNTQIGIPLFTQFYIPKHKSTQSQRKKFLGQIWKFLQEKNLNWSNFVWDNLYVQNFEFLRQKNKDFEQIGVLNKKDNQTLRMYKQLHYLPPVKYVHYKEFGSGFQAQRIIHKYQIIGVFSGLVCKMSQTTQNHNRIEFCNSRSSQDLYCISTTGNVYSIGPMFNGTQLQENANMRMCPFITQNGLEYILTASRVILEGQHLLWNYQSHYGGEMFNIPHFVKTGELVKQIALEVDLSDDSLYKF